MRNCMENRVWNDACSSGSPTADPMFLKEKTNRRPPGWDRAEPADGSCATPAGLREEAKREEHHKAEDRDEVKLLSAHFSLLLSMPT